jgi:hypothetical protein
VADAIKLVGRYSWHDTLADDGERLRCNASRRTDPLNGLRIVDIAALPTVRALLSDIRGAGD